MEVAHDGIRWPQGPSWGDPTPGPSLRSGRQFFRSQWFVSAILTPSTLRQAQESQAQGRLQPSPVKGEGVGQQGGFRSALRPGAQSSPSSQPSPARGRRGRGSLATCLPRPARLGGGAGSDPDQCAFGFRDAFLAHLVGGPLHPDALGLWRGAAASSGAESSSDRPGVCRGVLPDVLAVCVGDLAGDPVSDLLVVVVVFAVECGSHVVVCLDELVNRVGRVALGLGDLAADVVATALGVGRGFGFWLRVFGWELGRFDRLSANGFGFGGAGAGDGFPTARERPFDCAQGRLFGGAQDGLSGKDSVARGARRGLCGPGALWRPRPFGGA